MIEEKPKGKIDYFEMTSDGYKKAVEYLKKIGKYDLYKDDDGYSVVYAANYSLWEVSNGKS